jgi:DNA polymerase V
VKDCNAYERIYITIDLKSFYASVECRERGLNPLTTNLVVADSSRTEKTICLAVTPSLKKYGLSGRSRLYQVVEKVKEVNRERKIKNHGYNFTGKSYDDVALTKNPDLELDYIVAPPRMKYYMQYSTKIVNIYLQWFSIEDILVYSIDEVFIDVTPYLNKYKCTPRELATRVIKQVLSETGITATCGIGTNLYLAKIAMDIVAKHTEADQFGVRIAGLDEMSYRKYLWSHRPLTDFWRIGKGISQRLEKYGMYTMGDIARQSIKNEELLYKLFGVNAELIIDHAWGYEPSTIDVIKTYKPVTTSISSGQVLKEPYNYTKTKLIVKEMAELLSLDLVKKNYVTSKLVLEIGYDVSNLKNNDTYKGEVKKDRYGRDVPIHAHGTINIDHKTSSTKIITEKFVELFDRIIDRNLLTRRITLNACDLISSEEYNETPQYEQIDMFVDYNEKEKQLKKELAEKSLQQTMIKLKYRYGKNAILKGMNFTEGGTTIERNGQVGGHKG